MSNNEIITNLEHHSRAKVLADERSGCSCELGLHGDDCMPIVGGRPEGWRVGLQVHVELLRSAELFRVELLGCQLAHHSLELEQIRRLSVYSDDAIGPLLQRGQRSERAQRQELLESLKQVKVLRENVHKLEVPSVRQLAHELYELVQLRDELVLVPLASWWRLRLRIRYEGRRRT